MRLLVYELRPPELEREGLASALRRRLEAVEGRAGVSGRLVADDLGRLPEEIEQNLYRIAQEALNNVLKHASATAVSVRLQQQQDRVQVGTQVRQLEIVDNGLGFDPNDPGHEGGMGLVGMRERVAQMGGALAVHSEPGKGTQVIVELRLDPATGDNETQESTGDDEP